MAEAVEKGLLESEAVSKRLYYNKRNPSGYYGQYVVGFEKDDKVYPGELEMLKALLQKIKDSGIQPNN
jgi:hypothetical protein